MASAWAGCRVSHVSVTAHGVCDPGGLTLPWHHGPLQYPMTCDAWHHTRLETVGITDQGMAQLLGCWCMKTWHAPMQGLHGSPFWFSHLEHLVQARGALQLVLETHHHQIKQFVHAAAAMVEAISATSTVQDCVWVARHDPRLHTLRSDRRYCHDD